MKICEIVDDNGESHYACDEYTCIESLRTQLEFDNDPETLLVNKIDFSETLFDYPEDAICESCDDKLGE